MSIASSLEKLQTDLENAYNAIENANGTLPANKNTENLQTAITSLSTTDATATANDILNPKTAYVNGEKITGGIIPTYAPSSETITETINFSEINIFDYIENLNTIIYYKSDNTIIYFAKLTNNTIDFENEVEINSTDLLSVSTAFKNVKIQKNINDNGSYSVCALLGSNTVLFDINLTNFSIVGTPTILANNNTLIYPNPKYRYFALTHYSTSSSRDIFTSYLKILSVDTKQIVYSTSYTDSGVSGATNVSLWNITGMFSPNGEMFIMNCGGFNRYSAVNNSAGETRVIKFSDYFSSASIIKTMRLKIGCFIDDNTFKLGAEIYSYDGTNVTLLNSNSGVSTTTISRDFVSNGMYECFLNNKLYKFYTIASSKLLYIYDYDTATKTFTQSSVSNNYSAQSFFYRNSEIYHIKNNAVITTYYVPITNIITKLNRLNTDFVDTSSANALASDILNTKTAYVNGVKVTGTMPNNGALSYTPTTSQQTILAGYTSGGTVDGDANLVSGNIKSGTSIFGVSGSVVELNGETKTVIPTTSQQTITPTSPKNAITEITVNAVTSTIDSNIQAENIKDGVIILGVEGTLEEGIDTSDATATANDILSPETAYVNGSKVTGAIMPTYESGEFIGFTKVDANGITIKDIHLEGKIAASYSSSKITLYKIVNNVIDISSAVEYTLADLGCSSAGSSLAFQFADQLLDNTHLVYGVCGLANTSRVGTGIIDLTDLSVSNITSSSFSTNGQFMSFVKITGTNNSFMANYPYWVYSSGQLNSLYWTLIYKDSSTNNTIVNSKNTSVSGAGAGGGVWLYDFSNDGLSASVTYVCNDGSKFASLYLTRSNLTSNFNLIKTFTPTTTGYRLDPIGNELLLYENKIYNKSDTNRENPLGTIPYTISGRAQVKNISNTNYFVIGIGSTFRYFKISGSSVIEQIPVLTGNNNGTIFCSNQAALIYEPSSTSYATPSLGAEVIVTLNRSGNTFYSTSNSNVAVNDVLLGKIAYCSSGKIIGTMPNNGAITITPSTSNQTIPAGYTSGGSVSGDANLLPENIKAGVTIFGVTGTYTGD